MILVAQLCMGKEGGIYMHPRTVSNLFNTKRGVLQQVDREREGPRTYRRYSASNTSHNTAGSNAIR